MHFFLFCCKCVVKSDNLQHNMLAPGVDCMNDSSTKRLIFQALFFSSRKRQLELLVIVIFSLLLKSKFPKNSQRISKEFTKNSQNISKQFTKKSQRIQKKSQKNPKKIPKKFKKSQKFKKFPQNPPIIPQKFLKIP